MTDEKEPQKNKTGKPRRPPADVQKMQEKEYDQDAFADALQKATRRLDEPASPGRGSTRR